MASRGYDPRGVALDNAKDRARQRIREMNQPDLIAGTYFDPYEDPRKFDYSGVRWGGLDPGFGIPDNTVLPKSSITKVNPVPAPGSLTPVPPPPAIAGITPGKPLRVIVPGLPVKQQKQVRRAIAKIAGAQKLGQSSNSQGGGGTRGGYGNSYGPGGYQGGTYGGAAGRAINEGVGQAFKNR